VKNPLAYYNKKLITAVKILLQAAEGNLKESDLSENCNRSRGSFPFGEIKQGILTEREGSVQFTS
jgi:hypothetical protein